MAAETADANGLIAGPADCPGWLIWRVGAADEFNRAVLGQILARREGNGARVRLTPQRHHLNLNGAIHGGAIYAFADVAMFAGASLALDKNFVGGLTIELNAHFTGPGDGDRPLDALLEVVKETGRMVFMRGTMVQDADCVASFAGIFRKAR